MSSGGATPSNSKQLATQEVGKVTSREGKRRRQTEEEEGEIVSDGSDHEDQTKSRGSRHASVSDVEMKSQVSTEEGKKGVYSINIGCLQVSSVVSFSIFKHVKIPY